MTEESLRLAEALVFASPEPVPAATLGALLPAGEDAGLVLAALRERCAGRGVQLVEVAGGWQFRTAPDLAPRLTRVVEGRRRLPRAAMEVLAVVAYHQPVTRAEIEAVRGASLGQATLDVLLEGGLIHPAGRRDTPGRPTLWATTPGFLVQFGLRELRDLPRREELLEPPGAGPPGPEAAGPEGEAERHEARQRDPGAFDPEGSGGSRTGLAVQAAGRGASAPAERDSPVHPPADAGEAPPED